MRCRSPSVLSIALHAQTPVAASVRGGASESAAPGRTCAATAAAAMRVRPRPVGRRRARGAGTHGAASSRYRTGCHSERGKAGGLSLADFDVVEGQRSPGHRREDDPQAARGNDAAGRRAAARRTPRWRRS